MASLMEEIERDALNGKSRLTDVLRKCVALGGQSGSAELRDWARRELEGYRDADELPEYRRVPAPIRLDGHNMAWQFKGQTISPRDLPDFTHEHIKEEVPLFFGVGELESMVRQSDSHIKLTLPRAADLANYMNSQFQDQVPGQTITSLYWSVSPTAIDGVLDRIRTNLVSIVAEMRAVGIKGGQMPPAAAADQAVNVVINGKPRGPITITTANSSGEGNTLAVNPTPQPDTSLWARLRKPGAFIVGLAGVIGVLVAIAAWQSWNLF